MMQISESELKYLRLLSESYGTIGEASTEIINLMAIQNLPKGTEHFISDIHGEYESFLHILKNASGVIKLKIDETFADSATPEERRTFATLIYYPEEKLELIKKSGIDLHAFYRKTLYRLITLLGIVTVKYTRSYVRKQIPKEYAYIIEELLYGATEAQGKADYKDSIIESIIEINVADDFITKMAELIRRISVYKLHILGDIFDRGPGGDIVLDALMKHHSVDIQWGNHDILWMGAAAGNRACIANVIRICTRYDNLHTLEVGYGISIRPLVIFAMDTYGDDPCPNFKPIVSSKDALYASDFNSLAKVSKAIAIIQFKLEGQLIEKHPYYEMDALRLLHKVDYKNATVEIDGRTYELNNKYFPTIDPDDPYRLTEAEEAVMNRLRAAFLESEVLQKHVQFLFAKGSIYKCSNNNLMFHGCVPMEEDGSFTMVKTSGGEASGKAWFDYAERIVRQGYFGEEGSRQKERGVDFFWYLWCGYKSPLFGKKKITTFERCFIEDESTWVEEKNPYYKLSEQEEIVDKIAEEFGLPREDSHIINGHMPVSKGKNPVRANGRTFVIDGGFAKAYQKKTGVAGYSLIYNSYGFILTAHEPFESAEIAVQEERDILSTTVAKQNITTRILNKSTDTGMEMQDKIDSLKKLLVAYRSGLIKQRA
ncbi:fructose-1,6-bisphosphatase [Bacilliculturomica massiliensis]|uniref:fructose-1,6-bisphosphatase n=1 Tax=Bacilliculturomica massiliensis TaxID=1917867 RepID=UPI00102F8F17|nr:fructose-1,6-bisphosphatase [Bacilliculturomica massiliensis]